MIVYPSCVVNFELRFDETLIKTALQAASGEQMAKGAVAPPPSGKSYVFNIVPKTCTVELNGFRQAGTFNMQLEYRDFPFDPRVLRAVGVKIHMGAVTPEDFAAGIKSNTLPRTSALVPSLDNLVMYGLVDQITSEHSERGSLVNIEGRDLRATLLDYNANSDILNRLRLDMPINNVVEQIIADHPVFAPLLESKQIKVKIEPDDFPKGVPMVVEGALSITRVNRGAKGDKHKVPAQGEPDAISYWDLITQTCFLVGALPYFEDNVLKIRAAEGIYQQAKDARRLIYGGNLRKVHFERKLGGVKVPTVQCVCWDSSKKQRGVEQRFVMGQWPPESEQNVNDVSPSKRGGTGRQVMRIPVQEFTSKERLVQIAKSIHQEIARQELGGAIETKNLCRFDTDIEGAIDLLKLRPGDTVELSAAMSTWGARPPIISELTDHEKRSEGAEVREIASRLGDTALAAALVTAARGELQKYFRAYNIRFEWNAESGISVGFDFQNYVELRMEKVTKKAGAKQKKVQKEEAKAIVAADTATGVFNDPRKADNSSSTFDVSKYRKSK